MKVDKRLVGVVLVACLLLGGIGIGVAVGQTQHNTDDHYTASIMVDDAQYEGMTEAEESSALQELPGIKITGDEAVAIALAAYPDTTATTEVELENENGAVVYGVELSNGLDVKVDVVTGEILRASDDLDD